MTNDAQAPERREVIEETRESLDTLRLDRTARDEKMARENRLVEGAQAHEVHFNERSFAHASTLDEARAGVDALVVQRRELPEARPPPEPPAPVIEPEPAAPPVLTSDEEAALARVLPGRIVKAETLYRTDAAHAVEITHETPEGSRTSSYVLRDGNATSLDDIGRRIDDMAVPERPPPAASAPSGPEPAAEPAGKKSRFGLGRKKEKAPAAPSEPAPAEDAAAEAPPKEKKSRFGFGRK